MHPSFWNNCKDPESRWFCWSTNLPLHLTQCPSWFKLEEYWWIFDIQFDLNWHKPFTFRLKIQLYLGSHRKIKKRNTSRSPISHDTTANLLSNWQQKLKPLTVFFLSNQVSNCLIWILRKVACLFEDLKLPKIVILFANMVNLCNQDKKFKCFVPTQEVSKIKHKHKKMKFGSISLMSQV